MRIPQFVLTTALTVATAVSAFPPTPGCWDNFPVMTGKCSGHASTTHALSTFLETMDDDQWAEDNQLIAYWGGICAFYRDTGGGGSVGDAKKLMQKIVQWHCDFCGHCPVVLLEGDHGFGGELVIDYVEDRGGCDFGICPDFE